MRPGELVGFWESAPYDYGVMESTDLALLPDGRGWSTLENVGGLGVRRLTWHCPEPGVVELRYALSLSGVRGPGGEVVLDERDDDDEVVRTGYTLLPDTTLIAPAPFQALHLDESVDSCRTFGLRHREVTVADDPAHGAVPHV